MRQIIVRTYILIYRLLRFSWNITIEGDSRKIIIGKGSVLNKGAYLSVLYGGKINIGDNCEIHRGAIIATYGGNITIGNNSSVNYNTILYGHGGLNIGNFVRIAANVTIIPANHNFENPQTLIMQQGLTMKGVTIGNDVWIGAGTIILDGTTIEDGAVIGAGTVVVKNVRKNEISIGVPNRTIKKRDEKTIK